MTTAAGVVSQNAILKKMGDTPTYNENSPTSIELMAASKFLGRECAHVNQAYVKCKVNGGQNPTTCADMIPVVQSCTENIISIMNKNFRKEYLAFQNCLDKNDYRFSDCRKAEKDLIDTWNANPELRPK